MFPARSERETPSLGVTDAFNPLRFDSSPMAGNDEGLALTWAGYAAWVVIDEERCTAAAFTAMDLAASALAYFFAVIFYLLFRFASKKCSK